MQSLDLFINVFLAHAIFGILTSILMQRGWTKVWFGPRWERQAKKGLNKGKAPIYCRVKYYRTGRKTDIASDFSTGLWVQKVNWDQDEQQVKNTDNDFESINKKLTLIVRDIERIEEHLKISGVQPSAKLIKNMYISQGGEGRKGEVLIDTFTKFQEFKKKEISGNTYLNIRSYLRTFNTFLKKKGLDLISINGFNSTHSREFVDFLIHEKTDKKVLYESTTARNIYAHIKSLFDIAVQRELILRNPLIHKITQNKKKGIKYLEIDEVERFEHFPLNNLKVGNIFKLVKDVALIQLYTGMSYKDVFSLEEYNLIYDHQDKRNWIEYRRHKSKVIAQVPVISKVQKIIDEYGGIENLPRITNTHYNGTLKLFGAWCDIDKNLTSHMFRRTFGMIALNYWLCDIESVSRMLGHDSVETTQKYYATVLKNRVRQNMNKIR